MSLNLAGNPVAAAVPDLRDRVLGLLPELEAGVDWSKAKEEV